MMPPKTLVRQLAWECDQYGADVVAAFGEYCTVKARIKKRYAGLKRQGITPHMLTLMAQIILRFTGMSYGR